MSSMPANENTVAGRDRRADTAGFWTPGRILALIVAFGFGLRVLSALTRQMLQADEIAYVRIAENLAAGNGFVDISGGGIIYAPLLPMLIAGLSVLTRNFILAGYMIVTVFGALLLIPVYLLGRDLFSERTGLMAAALMAVMPAFIGTSEFLYSEGLYIFFQLLALFFAWHMLKERRLRCAAAAGISLGLAYLAQPSAIMYLLIILGLMAVAARRRGARGALAGGAGVFLLTFMIFAIPYVFFLHSELDRWTFTSKNMAGGIYSATHDIRRDDVAASEQALMSLTDEGEILVIAIDRLGNTPLDFIVGQPLAAAKNFLKQAFVLHGSVLVRVMPLWLLPVLGLGLFSREWTRPMARAYGYLLLMTAPVLLVLAMYAHSRFFMPYVPLGAILVAAGWQQLEEWGRQTAGFSFSGHRGQRWAARTPWLIAAAMLLPLLLNAALMVKQRNYEIQYKEAGQWLKHEGGDGSRVMNRDFASAYYAGAMHVMLPYADYDAMTEYARRRDVDFLVVGRRALVEYRPQQEVLMSDEAEHPDWQLMQRIKPDTAQETLIFRLVK